jgi:hypothetical protein
MAPECGVEGISNQSPHPASFMYVSISEHGAAEIVSWLVDVNLSSRGKFDGSLGVGGPGGVKAPSSEM